MSLNTRDFRVRTLYKPATASPTTSDREPTTVSLAVAVHKPLSIQATACASTSLEACSSAHDHITNSEFRNARDKLRLPRFRCGCLLFSRIAIADWRRGCPSPPRKVGASIARKTSEIPGGGHNRGIA